MQPLVLGGMTPFSTVDFPGCMAAVFFCQGCPWRCPYCHNPHLQVPSKIGPSWVESLAWLETRRGLLEAVVLSGGEPLLQPGLQEALRVLRGMGFRTGLHTGGCDPERLRACLPWLDWVGLDIKAPRRGYDRITGVAASAEGPWHSLQMLKARGGSFEIRTTVHSELLSGEDLALLGAELAEGGITHWVIQPFRPQGCVNKRLLTPSLPYSTRNPRSDHRTATAQCFSGSVFEPGSGIQWGTNA